MGITEVEDRAPKSLQSRLPRDWWVPCGAKCLDHVIVLGETASTRILTSYLIITAVQNPLVAWQGCSSFREVQPPDMGGSWSFRKSEGSIIGTERRVA